ncbi:prolyl oligopeptidase family serine peptidase [Alphaproteobacteria bacterium]|nr:prolyl oligopeptidase family serine peptidase [Alphaproteobacteria bacterium]
MQKRKIHTKSPTLDIPPKQIVFFLHGYGADGADLIDLSSPFSLVLPYAKFISPDAPFDCKMSPMGKEWFPIEDIPNGAIKASNELLNLIKVECDKENLKFGNVLLIGFSQGAMMSIQSLLLSDHNFLGIVGYSGGTSQENINASKHLIYKNVHRNSSTPILLVHGEEDDVVPFSSLEHAKKLLTEIGFDVKTVNRPGLAHGIDPDGISAGMDFVKNIIKF